MKQGRPGLGAVFRADLPVDPPAGSVLPAHHHIVILIRSPAGAGAEKAKREFS